VRRASRKNTFTESDRKSRRWTRSYTGCRTGAAGGTRVKGWRRVKEESISVLPLESSNISLGPLLRPLLRCFVSRSRRRNSVPRARVPYISGNAVFERRSRVDDAHDAPRCTHACSPSLSLSLSLSRRRAFEHLAHAIDFARERENSGDNGS